MYKQAATIPKQESSRSLSAGKNEHVLTQRILCGLGTDRASHDAMFHRVATAIAQAESDRLDSVGLRHLSDSYLLMLSSLDFLPNSPTLINAGTPIGVLSGCFVLPLTGEPGQVDDSLSLMQDLQQAGAGTGFSFSDLEAGPHGRCNAAFLDQLLHRIDRSTDENAPSSPRRGANMGLLRVDHPAISSFIASKRERQSLTNFNLSVGVNDLFMECVLQRRRFALRDPKTRRPVARVWAADLLHEIAQAAWASGDPGVIFLDAIERANPVPAIGPLNATNPCGEVPLLPYESCNLGSINLANMLRDEPVGGVGIDWRRIARTTRLAVRFLDDVIDATRWPDDRIAEATRRTRKIGLGVMGFADMLVRLRIAYDSSRAEQVAAQVMAFISHCAHSASSELADQRGNFPA